MAEIKVLALVGSLRAASINRKIAELAVDVAPEDVAVTLFEGLADLPFYNEEIDDVMNTEAPSLAPVDALRAAAGEADAALVVTPEYNGSIPAGGSYNGMGFNGSWNNVTNAVPASFAVSGTTCK